ncbi:MAG: hypothetical protein JOS17DRAFT_757783 [Linnemannia elongata]|nr:MAG: hypothetical protein JOS17DRAFT_757783 [Linnemannia elongata]
MHSCSFLFLTPFATLFVSLFLPLHSFLSLSLYIHLVLFFLFFHCLSFIRLPLSVHHSLFHSSHITLPSFVYNQHSVHTACPTSRTIFFLFISERHFTCSTPKSTRTPLRTRKEQ